MYIENDCYTSQFAGSPQRSPRDCDTAPTSRPGDSTAASTPGPRRAAGGRVIRTEYLNSSSLGPVQRLALIDQLYEIYCATVCGDSRTEFEALIFAAGEVRLALFYGAHAELAGFSYAAVEVVKPRRRSYAAFFGGVYFRPGYHDGASAVLFAIRYALAFKLRRPQARMAYLTRSTPAAYRLLASAFPRHYPNRSCPTPDEVETLVRLLGERRGYVPVNGNPWVVHEENSQRNPRRLNRLHNDPYMQFFLQLDPNFAEGNSLVTWIPLDLANVAVAVVRLMRKRSVR